VVKPLKVDVISSKWNGLRQTSLPIFRNTKIIKTKDITILSKTTFVKQLPIK
jgi:hypothetical protein